MAVIFDQVDALAAELAERLIAPAIVGIDGWTGVGKTTMAKSLAAALNGSTYDLDNALDRDRNSFVSALRMNEIFEALAHPSGILFVSGVCLRQVLQNARCSVDAHIYLKRMATWGWADEDEVDGSGAPEVPGASGETLREEMRLYHRQWQPHLKADYEFHRFD